MDGFERALKSPAAPPPVQCLQMEVGLLGRAGGENQISLEKEGGREREVAGCGSSKNCHLREKPPDGMKIAAHRSMTEGERYRRRQSHPSNTTFVRQQSLDINAKMYMNFPNFLLLCTLARST